MKRPTDSPPFYSVFNNEHLEFTRCSPVSHAAWLRSVSRFPQTTCAPPLIPNANHSSFAYSHIYPRSHPRGCSQCSVVTVPVHNAHVRSRSLTMPLGDSSPSPGSSVTSNILLRHTPSPRHIRPAAVTYANRLFDQFSPPIALLQSVIQQTQLLGHGIHLTLPILDRDRCLDPDLRTARTIRGLTGGRHGRPVETDPQHQCIPLCDEFRQRMPVDRNLRVGQVDAGDQILKSFDGKVQFTPQILGNLQRLLPPPAPARCCSTCSTVVRCACSDQRVPAALPQVSSHPPSFHNASITSSLHFR